MVDCIEGLGGVYVNSVDFVIILKRLVYIRPLYTNRFDSVYLSTQVESQKAMLLANKIVSS